MDETVLYGQGYSQLPSPPNDFLEWSIWEAVLWIVDNHGRNLTEAWDDLIQLHNCLVHRGSDHINPFERYAKIATVRGIEPLLRERKPPDPLRYRTPPRGFEQIIANRMAECPPLGYGQLGKSDDDFPPRKPFVRPLVHFLTGRDIDHFTDADRQFELYRVVEQPSNPDELLYCLPDPPFSLPDEWLWFSSLLERWHVSEEDARRVPGKYRVPIYMLDRSGKMALIREPNPPMTLPSPLFPQRNEGNIWLSVPRLWFVHRSHVEFVEKRDGDLAAKVDERTSTWMTGRELQASLKKPYSELDQLVRDGKLKPYDLIMERASDPREAIQPISPFGWTLGGGQFQLRVEDLMFKFTDVKAFRKRAKSPERMSDEDWLRKYYDRRKGKNPDVKVPKILEGARIDYSQDRKEQEDFNKRWTDNQMKIVFRLHTQKGRGRPRKANPKKR